MEKGDLLFNFIHPRILASDDFLSSTNFDPFKLHSNSFFTTADGAPIRPINITNLINPFIEKQIREHSAQLVTVYNNHNQAQSSPYNP